ncbi:uncharacterized protein G2W53_039543 [Senna tora]|uniref:Retrotransposon gag domain-containing protein n=1 Tax=Senna tora TaxID=362788 RepID=A0A834W2W6_9FABA|nr:uncharacterized protein G2W53_039543 [Senna tora]
MELDETANFVIKKKTPEHPLQSAVWGDGGPSKDGNSSKTTALLASRRAGKHPEITDQQQNEVQKTTPEQASATTPIYDDLILALLEKQDELKKELRASKCKITDLEKVIAQKQDEKIPEKANSEKSTSTPRGSISSFKQLTKKFTKYFATSRTIKRTSHCLKNIIQGESEPLKDFLDKFTKVARQIQGLKHEVALNYLTDNLRDGPFYQSITKKPPSSMEELMD